MNTEELKKKLKVAINIYIHDPELYDNNPWELYEQCKKAISIAASPEEYDSLIDFVGYEMALLGVWM